MKKSYVTTMPDHIGAFLKASRCFSALGINITRVSYNKAVDMHTLFIDAEGTPEQLSKADEELERIGYIHSTKNSTRIVLLDFILDDEPGKVGPVLELIDSYGFNISYISSQADGSGIQHFKMGLFVEDQSKVNDFVKEAGDICEVRIVDYNQSDKVFDNSIFYQSFVRGLSESMRISDESKERLLIDANMAMQTLDERGLSPYQVFESIGRIADMLSASKGQAFAPRITYHNLSEKVSLTLIEPPCGSNTIVMRCGDEILFLDCGYACYGPEMMKILKEIIPGFDGLRKKVLLSHADVDHVGFSPDLDEIFASELTAECLRLEYEGKDGFRECNALHKPYISICKILTSYAPPSPDKVKVLWSRRDDSNEPLSHVGYFDFGDMHFEVLEGKGGHLKGEIVLIDYVRHVAFTGDIYVNIHGMTAEQSRYNKYAPILMTSVDTDAELCKMEREAVFQRLGAGEWQVFGAHGYKLDYKVEAVKAAQVKHRV